MTDRGEEGWFTSPVAVHLIAWARKQGVDVDAALAEARLDASEVTGQPRRLSVAAVERLLAALGRRIPDESFALRSGAVAPAALIPLLGPMMTASMSLEEAFEALGRHSSLASDRLVVQVERSGERLCVTSTWLVRSELIQRHATESAAAHWVAFADTICLEAPPVQEVRFPFAPPSAAAQRAHREYFGVAPNYGGSTGLQVAWTLGADTRLRTQDATLVGILRQPIEDETVQPGTRRRVERALLAAKQPAALGVEAMAAELGISARTLARRLASDGTSFGELAQRTLEGRAKAALAAPDATVGSVARDLGYATRNSFHRAFLRWTGATPAQWKRGRSARPPGSD
ncbi:MAG: AraC family transcriptional regulator ligand-binding domain-containing protein [Myxococcota bacterium]